MPITRTMSRNGSHGSKTEDSDFKPSSSALENGDGQFARPRKRSRDSDSGLPGWVPWALGTLGLGAIIYGLFQIESVRNAVNDFLSGDEFEENEYAPRSYDDESDFGSGDFGSSTGERVRSQL